MEEENQELAYKELSVELEKHKDVSKKNCFDSQNVNDVNFAILDTRGDVESKGRSIRND